MNLNSLLLRDFDFQDDSGLKSIHFEVSIAINTW